MSYFEFNQTGTELTKSLCLVQDDLRRWLLCNAISEIRSSVYLQLAYQVGYALYLI